MQLEVICSLLTEKYHIDINVKEPTVIYLEKPLQKADYTIHIEVPPNPFWASIGLSVTPLPIGSGIQYESKVSLGYLNQSFQNAVMDGIDYGLEFMSIWYFSVSREQITSNCTVPKKEMMISCVIVST